MKFENIFYNIMELSKKSIPTKENDYEKDGLIYCGNCNTPKQTKIMFKGEELKPMCLCECMKKEKEKEREKENIKKIEEIRKRSFFDLELCTYTFENDNTYNKKITDLCKRYIEKWEEMKKDNIGLMFWGDTGTGKTYFAACIANYLINKSERISMKSLPELLNELSNFEIKNKNEYIDDICNVDLLIIDDLGSERQSEYAMEIVYDIINTRYLKKKPLIVTTNITLDEMKKTSNLKLKRIYSRILEMCVPVLFSGSDQRIKKSKDKRQALYDYITESI